MPGLPVGILVPTDGRPDWRPRCWGYAREKRVGKSRLNDSLPGFKSESQGERVYVAVHADDRTEDIIGIGVPPARELWPTTG
jgi:hypothetical protein